MKRFAISPPESVERSPTPKFGSRALAAAAVTIIVLAFLLPELDRPGVTWDEPEYFSSVERIQGWVSEAIRDPRSALEPEVILAAWDPPESRYYNPHPPVYKQGMALTERVFGDRSGPVSGYRLFSATLFALLAGLLAWSVSGAAGIAAGIGAALSLALMPRVAGHAHFATTDVPLTFFWTLTVVSFASFLRQGGGGRLFLAAIALGLAMGTKFTGWLLPIPLLAWALLERRWWPWIVTLLVGLLVAWLFVPPAWHDPEGALRRLVEESLTRDESIPIATAYLGRIYEYVVPWHQAIVMMLITIPVGILSLAVIGTADLGRSRTILRPPDPRAAMARLSLLQIGFFLALMALPTSPNHDGVRLFLPAFPFVAILAGLALGRFDDALRSRFEKRAASLGLLLVMSAYLLPAFRQERAVAPYWTSYYNELVGGLRGASAKGMEVTYWYDAFTPEFISEVERILPEGATVMAWPTAKYFAELQELGLLRDDLRIVNDPTASYLLMMARQATLPPPLMEVYRTVRPIVAVEVEGVELAGLYELSAQGSGGEPFGGE